MLYLENELHVQERTWAENWSMMIGWGWDGWGGGGGEKGRWKPMV